MVWQLRKSDFLKLEPVEKHEQSTHSDYETLEAQDGNFIQEPKVPAKVELTEAEKMDLYSKVIKRKPR